MSRAGRTKSFASVTQSLRQSRNPVLAEAVDRCRALTPLNTAWNQAVAQPLCRHVQPVSQQDGVLTVHAESPVWANLLRNTEQTTVAALRASGLSGLRSLRIRIAPPDVPREPAPVEEDRGDGPELRRQFERLRRALD